MAWSPRTSSYHRIHAILDQLISTAHDKENMDEHLKLVELLETDRHLLVGAKALAAYIKQRFSEDTDYVVGHRTFQKVRKWLKQQRLAHEDNGEAIQVGVLGIDIIDARHHPVLQEILKRENGIPSPEALAATKYIAIVSATRGPQKRHFDIGDFIGLVTLDGFDVERFLEYLVGNYAEQRPHAREVIDRIQKGESPITI
ncbi:MAG: hypothetical protein V2A79_16360 [Planctomycetota bacterium]